MVPGFNTNVERQGVVFHLQSEDSGRSHPHIITHLYHGGTILESEKQSYADAVDRPDLPTYVRGLMEAQHEALLSRLEGGALDRQISERLGADVFPVADHEDATPPESGLSGPAGGTASATPVPAAQDERPLDEWVLDYLIERSQRDKARVP